MGDFADDCNCAEVDEGCEADAPLGGLGLLSCSFSLPSPSASSFAMVDLDLGTFPAGFARRLCIDAPTLGMVQRRWGNQASSACEDWHAARRGLLLERTCCFCRCRFGMVHQKRQTPAGF